MAGDIIGSKLHLLTAYGTYILTQSNDVEIWGKKVQCQVV